MQETVVEKPYRFIPPRRGTSLPRVIRKFRLFEPYLRKAEGVIDYEVRHVERLKQSLAAGHGIMLTPNHCRTADPLVLGWLCVEAQCFVYAMASWHLFNQGRFYRWAIRVMGGFSVHREGTDRKAVETAIDILSTAQRPLVIFPEGYTSRMNDRLQSTLEGVPFIARRAAKTREKQHGKVVVHPIAIKYQFRGDLRAAVAPSLDELEQRLTWRPKASSPLLDRIEDLRQAFVSLKELAHFGAVQSGDISRRQENLIAHLLSSLEQKWLGGRKEHDVVPRAKSLRMQIIPGLVANLGEDERAARWRDLLDIELAHHLSCWPADYLAERPTVDRILETVERLEEYVNGRARVHQNLKVVIDIGEALEVSPERKRKAQEDALMTEVESRMQAMLNELSLESPLYETHPQGGK